MRTKILYVASTESHLCRFHIPYIEALQKEYEVKTMATGKQIDFPVLFDKHFFSVANLKSIRTIRGILKRERFDAVLVHTTLAAFLVRAAMLGWGRKRRPYVLNVVHGYLFSGKLGGMRDRVLYLCERLMRGKTDDIAVMNQEDMAFAKAHRLCRGQVYFINGMGVNLPKTFPPFDAALRAKYAAEGEFLCTFVGELSGRKNQRFLVDAVKRLRDEGMPIRLLLLGEGSERENLEAQINECGLADVVTLTGNVEPVLPYLAVSDLYVSASISEGLPFNVMEAMAAGLPIVASDTKGQNDLLADADGCLYPLGDADAFCNAVQHVYASKRFGAGSRAYPSLEKYRLNEVFEENMKLLTMGLDRKEG